MRFLRGRELPRHLTAAAFGAVLTLCVDNAALGQGADELTYVVAYIEVAPNAAAEARGLLLSYGTEARGTAGLLHVDALQRVGYANQFALLEIWRTAKAQEAYAAAGAASKFLAILEPLRIAGYDARVHAPLSVGSYTPASPEELVTVTHIDVIPTVRDAGVAKVREFTEHSRGTTGNRRFDALIQSSRPNHMTLIEGWSTPAARDAHVSAGFVRAFREALMPMSGSLYDERLYEVLR